MHLYPPNECKNMPTHGVGTPPTPDRLWSTKLYSHKRMHAVEMHPKSRDAKSNSTSNIEPQHTENKHNPDICINHGGKKTRSAPTLGTTTEEAFFFCPQIFSCYASQIATKFSPSVIAAQTTQIINQRQRENSIRGQARGEKEECTKTNTTGIHCIWRRTTRSLSAPHSLS